MLYHSLLQISFNYFQIFFLFLLTIESWLQLQVHADRRRSPGEDARRQDVRRVVHRDGQREGDQGGERRVGGHSP